MRKVFVVFALIFFLTKSYSQLTEISNFGTNLGNLKMYVYIPQNLNNPAPLVVALHGCSQTASSYANETGWNTLAEKYGFIVIYPEQKSTNNTSLCFNWFLPINQAPSTGEASSIFSMINYVKQNYTVNNEMIFASGLSAGASMVSVLLACFPDVFTSGAIMAGVPFKPANDYNSASQAMAGNISKTQVEWTNLVRNVNPQFSGIYPKISIFHGLLDNIVSPNNINEIVKQFTGLHNVDASVDNQISNYHENSLITKEIYCNSNQNAIVEVYKISMMGHATSVNPGICPNMGGSATGFAVDANFHSTYYACKFFGIIPSTNIIGEKFVTTNQQLVPYFVLNTSGSTYNWSLSSSSANIYNGQGTNQIQVNFTNSNIVISVQETATGNCILPKESLQIEVGNNIDKPNLLGHKLNYINNCIYLNDIDDFKEKAFVEIYDSKACIVLKQQIKSENNINLYKLKAGFYNAILQMENKVIDKLNFVIVR